MSNIKLLDFEIKAVFNDDNSRQEFSLENIERKYSQGFSRVVTETGSYKVNLLKDIFRKENNYELEPDYQRRITWNNQKRSKLIESLIMNIPIPPIYLYERDYNQYEIMDGLQRVTAIIDFYNDKYNLNGLEEWPELNGLKYSKLPRVIREGIDRRQLSVITLLKETASDGEHANMIKRLVFERLNTGGVKLNNQEIRNALYDGRGNDLCKRLSSNQTFRRLWNMPELSDTSSDFLLDDDNENDYIFNKKEYKKLMKNSLYKRMADVEIVLRFFSMRQIYNFNAGLSNFFDTNLRILNNYTDSQISALENLFNETIEKANYLFGDHAFKMFKDNDWTLPLKMIYDPIMVVLSSIDIDSELASTIEERQKDLQKFYYDYQEFFGGKLQTKEDILHRINLFESFLNKYEPRNY